jgi:hypothetical protein
MQSVNKVVIKGAGFFEGDIEGKHFETGQVFIEEEFDRTKPNYKGFRTVEYKCTDSDVVHPIMHNTFPITAEVTFDMSATKRGMSVIVTAIKPLELARPMPKAA